MPETRSLSGVSDATGITSRVQRKSASVWPAEGCPPAPAKNRGRNRTAPLRGRRFADENASTVSSCASVNVTAPGFAAPDFGLLIAPGIASKLIHTPPANNHCNKFHSNFSGIAADG